MFCDNHNTIQLSMILPLHTIFETPIPKVGKVNLCIKYFKIKTMKEPANPPANKENPKNKITLAAQALVFSSPKNEFWPSANKFDFSIRLTINMPKVEQMNGIQSTKLIWTTLALTVFE